jgi:hypothetical protein
MAHIRTIEPIQAIIESAGFCVANILVESLVYTRKMKAEVRES